ncbi:MAG: methyltransferase domain-containing protein [Patescibacteria group bacterium]
MSWLTRKDVVPSPKNGEIITRRRGRAQEVFVKGCGQTTDYTNAMWTGAFERLAVRPVRPAVLMLGLGGGGGVSLLYEYFPGCTITAVEYDPVMIKLAREALTQQAVTLPTIMEMDAALVFSHIAEKFDVIIVDLFDGPEPSLLSKDTTYLRALQAHLNPSGVVLLNVYKNKEYLEAASGIFGWSDVWTYKENHLGAFRTTAVGFTPPDAWKEYGMVALPAPLCRRENVEGGTRWCLWPLCFELYTSDTEPNIASNAHGALAYNRIVLWKRVARTDVPAGWHAPMRPRPWRTDGFFELQSGVDYTELWHKKARHDVRRWREDAAAGKYRVEPLSFGQFAESYKKSTAYKKAGSHLLEIFERKWALPETRAQLVLWGVRDVVANKIIAGMAVHYPPSQSASVRECPFMLKEATSSHAMTGVMDYWFAESQRRGVMYQVFTYFWQRGDSRQWKGFSVFKSHFVQQYVVYPPLLWRFVRDKFW